MTKSPFRIGTLAMAAAILVSACGGSASTAPSDGGNIPEISVVRAGAHTGAHDQTRLNSIPFAASASTFGVVANLSP